MNIAIYTRKSKQTDQGDSVSMQADSCKSYINLNYPEEGVPHHITVYCDEGFSGGNLSRPAFQLMMQTVAHDALDLLICYRLDRVSRNIADFSETYRVLEQHHVQFVSVKEQFDTTTPMGRAMLSIALVFSQLERETIAERIRDNLLALGEKGHWLGGTTPLGYTSRKTTYSSSCGKLKCYYELALKMDEVPVVKLIYDQYLTLGSLSQLAHFLIAHKILTRLSRYYSPTVLKEILTNPTYTSATENVYDYYQSYGCHMAFEKAQCTSNFAILPFNRCRKNVKKPMDQWIIALGTHQPIISSNQWLLVQQKLLKNASKAFGHPPKASKNALLSGFLYCGICGAPMKVTNQSTLADGSPSYIYRCSNKLRSKGTLCQSENIKGHYLDPLILEKLLALGPSQKTFIAMILQTLLQYKHSPLLEESTEAKPLNKSSLTPAIKIENLLEALSLTSDRPTQLVLLKKLESLKAKNEPCLIKEPLSDSSPLFTEGQLSQLIYTLTDPSYLIRHASLEQKRHLLSQLISHIDWYPTNSVDLFLGTKNRNLIQECKITHAER